MRLPSKQAKLYQSANVSPSSNTAHSTMRNIHCATIPVARGPTYAPADGAFDLDNDSAYGRWRTRKLENYPLTTDELFVEVKEPCELTAAERKAII